MFKAEKYHTFRLDGHVFNVSCLDLELCRDKKTFVYGVKTIRDKSFKVTNHISLKAAKSVADEIAAMTPEQFERLFESDEDTHNVSLFDDMVSGFLVLEARVSVLESEINALNKKVDAILRGDLENLYDNEQT